MQDRDHDTDQCPLTDERLLTAASPEGDEHSLYLNRELSWLDFNDRVLQLAEDEDVPLLEGVTFGAINTTTLPEYFLVRVAGFCGQIDAAVANPSKAGVTPPATLALIRERVLGQ